MSGMDDVFRTPIGEEEKLLAQLRLAAELDPVPAELGEAVKAAFSLMTLDADLAELTYDSSEDERALVGVRDTEPSRFLTFEAPALIVEVEALPEVGGGGRRLVGQLSPPQRATVVVRHGGGAATVEVDELGRFLAEGIAPGPVSLHCEPAEGAGVVSTDWVIV